MVEPVAAVHPELDVGQVAGGVLGEVEGVVRAGEGGLEVAQHGVDGGEVGVPSCLAPAAGDDALVHAGVARDGEAACWGWLLIRCRDGRCAAARAYLVSSSSSRQRVLQR